MMVPMASRNHWSLRNQRSHRDVFFHFEDEGSIGLLGLDGGEGGEGVFSSPLTISWRFMSSFPVTSVIPSSLLRWWMSSFDKVCEGVVEIISIAAGREV